MPKLTKRIVDALKSQEKDLYIWDDELPGFGIRLKPSGVKSYIVQYKNAVGRSKRATLGKHGVLTADAARKQAKQIMASVAGGADPVTEKSIARKAPIVRELFERYMKEHVMVHNKPSTAKNTSLLLGSHIIPGLGKMKVAGVTRNDVSRLHRNMSATPRQANLVLSIISKAFNLAEVWGWREESTNPVRLIKRYPENKRERFLSGEELTALGATLVKAEQEQTELPNVVAVIRLLALTGCRLSEILTLKWDYIDFRTGMLNLPDGKSGAKTQSLATSALEILSTLPKIEGVDWVLPNKFSTDRIDRSNMERAWRRVRKSANLEDVRMHDLRHTTGTIAGATGANAFMVRDLLGHKSLAMTGRYVNRDADPQRALVEQVASQINAAMSGKPTGEVVAFKKKGQF